MIFVQIFDLLVISRGKENFELTLLEKELKEAGDPTHFASRGRFYGKEVDVENRQKSTTSP